MGQWGAGRANERGDGQQGNRWESHASSLLLLALPDRRKTIAGKSLLSVALDR
jgi:hypothetical protein